MNFLDVFGGGGGYGSPTAGLLGQNADLSGLLGGGTIDPVAQALLSAYAGFQKNSGPSRMPVTLGPALGEAAEQGLQGYNQAQGMQLQRGMLSAQLVPVMQRARLLNEAMSDPNSAPQGAGTSTASGATGSTTFQPGSTPGASGGGMLGGLGVNRTDIIRDALAPGYLKEIMVKQNSPTDAVRALQAAGVDPQSPLGQQMLTLAAQNATGVKPYVGGERPGVPLQRYNTATGRYEMESYVPTPIPGANLVPTGNGQYGFQRALGADFNMGANAGIEQGARVAAESAIKSAEFQRSYGIAPPGGGGNGSVGNFNVGGAAPGGGQGGNAAAAPGDIATPKGTIVPSAAGTQKLGPSGEEAALQFKNSAETEKNWNSIRPSIEQNRQRLGALSDAFQQVETKGYTVAKTDIANKLRGLGLTGVADTLQGAKDTAAVQSALWNGMQEVLQSLKVVNQGTGGRILNSEFNAYMEHSFSPDMVGPALHKAISAQLGQTYQVGNMIDDYYKTGKLAGWRDANQYQSAYLSKNPVENFVDYATNTTPAFKGMDKAIPPDVLRDANSALMKGAPKEAIRKRLQENGYDASKF